MDKATTNPLIVSLFFVLRCLVPMLLMLGVSYLLKRFGLVAEPPSPQQENGANNHLYNTEGS